MHLCVGVLETSIEKKRGVTMNLSSLADSAASHHFLKVSLVPKRLNSVWGSCNLYRNWLRRQLPHQDVVHHRYSKATILLQRTND